MITQDTRHCPECGADWLGHEIPEKHRHYYGGKTHGTRLIGIYSREQDRTVAWRCPDCGWEWPR